MKSVGENPLPEASVNSVNSVGGLAEGGVGMAGCHTLLRKLPQIARMCTLSLQKKAIRLNNQGKTMIAKDSFVPLL